MPMGSICSDAVMKLYRCVADQNQGGIQRQVLSDPITLSHNVVMTSEELSLSVNMLTGVAA